MRRLRCAPSQWAALVLLVAAHSILLVALSEPAAACEVDASGICLEGSEIGEEPDDAGEFATEPIDSACRDESGTAVPCVDGYGGSWSGAPQWCYQYQLSPQPSAGSQLWGANDPSEGTLWSCDYSVAVPGNTWFVPNGQAVVDAGSIARDLMSRADFEYADAATAPGGAQPTYVGYRTWLWVAGEQWHPVSASVTIAGATVTIRATPTGVEWTLGSRRMFCDGPGRAWKDGYPEDAETRCSVVFEEVQEPDGDELAVSARIRYAVAWTCVGSCSDAGGDLGEIAALAGSPTELLVKQRQTVVTR